MTISEVDQEKYAAAIEAKRKELGLNARSEQELKPDGAIMARYGPGSEVQQSQDFARPDVFAPQLIVGDRTKWNSFNIAIHPEAATIKTTVGRWFNEAAPSGFSCLIEGDCGTGKTHIAEALRDAFPYVPQIDNKGAMLVNEVEYIEQLKESWSGPSSSTMKLNDLLIPHVLIFDDLGAYETRDAGWLQNIYYNIFDGRCEAGKPTLFLTNMALEKDRGFGLLKDRIGVRNYDRLLGATAIREPHSEYVLGKTVARWHGEMYNTPSARSGESYISKLLSSAKKKFKS